MKDLVITDEKWLKSIDDIEAYFKDEGSYFLPCGQGYATDEADVFVGIGDKYYRVTIMAEIESAKQDCGDRLYWVEKIDSVTFVEVSAKEVLYAVQSELLGKLGSLQKSSESLFLQLTHARDTIK